MSKVAILLSTYNGSDYLGEFLESLVCQRFKDFDVIVRDDGSSDDTLSIISGYANRLTVRHIASSGNIGAAWSFMTLVRDCGGVYSVYMFADQDDVWLPDKVQRAHDFMLSVPGEGPALYFSRLEIVDEELRNIGFSRVPRVISFENSLVENIATGCTIAVNAAARDCLISRLPKRLIMHDWWCFLSISALGRIIYDEAVTIKYRQHAQNVVGASRGVVDEICKRAGRWLSRKSSLSSISGQVEEFINCHGRRVSAEHLELLHLLIKAKSSVGGRFSLLRLRRFRRQRPFDTVILLVILALGLY
jgi:glycosyltransferase involved in cell wall biosynthesis